MNVQFDMREVTRFAADLGKVSPRVVPALVPVLDGAAVQVRDKMRQDAGGHTRFRYLPAAITHEVRGLTAEIGPDKTRRGGAIANIVYFGTVHNGPVLPHPSTALTAARPALEAAVPAAVRGVVEGALR